MIDNEGQGYILFVFPLFTLNKTQCFNGYYLIGQKVKFYIDYWRSYSLRGQYKFGIIHKEMIMLWMNDDLSPIYNEKFAIFANEKSKLESINQICNIFAFVQIYE